jgi:hypothetical protein
VKSCPGRGAQIFKPLPGYISGNSFYFSSAFHVDISAACFRKKKGAYNPYDRACQAKQKSSLILGNGRGTG